MAGYKSGQVNVGSLINPTEGLSRSLMGLSSMYGKQAADEQSQLNREQDILRRQERLTKTDALAAKNRKEDLAYKEAGRVENERRYNILQGEKADARALSKRKADAMEAGNQFFIAANEGRNPDLVESDYNRPLQKEFRSLRDSWDSQEAVTRKAALSGNVKDIEAAVKAMPSGKGVDARETTASQSARRTNLGILNKAVLDAKTPEEKQQILDKGMQDIFGGRRAELNKSIAEGSFLTNKQKVNALMRYAPKDFVRFGNAAAMQSNLLSTMSGTTKQELKTAENQRVAARNKELESAAKADSTRYKAELKARKSKSDWKGLGKLLEKDLGNFFSGNNDDKADIIDFMISEGVPHDQITFEVNRLISEASNMFGDSIPDAKDPKVLKMVTGRVADLKKSGKLSGKPIIRPSGYTPEVARSVDEIQKDMFRTGGGKVGSTIQLQDGWDKYRAKKSKAKETLPDPVVKPASETPATEEPVVLSAYGNPLPKDFKLNAMQQAGVDTANALSEMGTSVAGNVYEILNPRESTYKPKDGPVEMTDTSKMRNYILGGNTFGTNSNRVSVLNKAGVPKSLAHKAANNREDLTSGDIKTISDKLSPPTGRVPLDDSTVKGAGQNPSTPSVDIRSIGKYSDKITNEISGLDNAVNVADKALSLVHPDNVAGRSKATSAKAQAMSKRMEASAKRAAAELLKAGLSPGTIKGKHRDLVSKYYSELQEQFLET